MNWRLFVAVVSTLLDDIAVVIILLLVLPNVGIHLPVPAVIGIGIAWTIFAVFLYIAGSKILRKKPLAGFTDMVGLHGTAAENLNPKGIIKIKGERWSAQSDDGFIPKGDKVIVEHQSGMQLVVRKSLLTQPKQ